MVHEHGCILFDWGDTLMRNLPGFAGPMATWPRVEVVPHAQEVLAELQTRWMLALATNAVDSQAPEIQAALRRGGLDQLLDRIYCYRLIGYRKPSPQFFTYVLDDLQIDRSHVFMVGDDFETDISGANRSGIRAVWFNERTDEIKTGEMFRTIHDLRTLPQALASFE